MNIHSRAARMKRGSKKVSDKIVYVETGDDSKWQVAQ